MYRASNSRTASINPAGDCSPKKRPVFPARDRFQRAASSVGNDRAARRLRLDDGNAKILLGGTDKGARLPQKFRNLFVRLITQKADIRSSHGFQPPQFWSPPDDHQGELQF
jgi:hypothetical protein